MSTLYMIFGYLVVLGLLCLIVALVVNIFDIVFLMLQNYLSIKKELGEYRFFRRSIKNGKENNV